jgi:hypothetical protein
MASRAALKRLLLYYVLLLMSCGTSGADKVRDDAKKIATMQCESRELTNQKFLLAGRYSTLELQTAEKKLSEAEAEKIRSELDKEKMVLVTASQQKADELLAFLRQVWSQQYQSEREKKALDSLTEVYLKKDCRLAAP